MIIQLGGRSTEDARALLERALTEMKPKKAAPPERTAAQDRLEATRMRDKIRGTTKMRAAIAGALDKLHDSVLRAVGLREADGDDDEQTPSQFAAAADAAAAGWDDAVFSDAIDEIVRELFEKAGTGAAAELKTSWDLVPESAIDALLREELAFSKQFVDRERIALRAMLKDALANGTPVRELADEIRDFFANGVHYVDEKGNVGRTMPADSWAETVARTETSRAYNAGHMAMYRANDTKRIRWLTAEDERVCPECAELEQATTVVGEPFPGTDVTEPPLHPSCRCTTIGVWPGEAS